MHTRPVPASVPSAPALELRGITKRYPGTLALDGVDLVLQGGEVHALLGENGAGKSTLLQVIAGGFDDYEGEVRVAGRSVRLHSPAAARACGIALVHQELNLAPPQSVAENVLAGRLPRRAGVLVDRRALREGAARALARVGLDVDPGLPVEALSQAEAQLVEIAKALSADPRILVLDEPTSALGREEAERLLAIVRRLRDEGLAIVFVSHHLAEVFAVADRVTVLRDGRRVASGPAAETSPAAVAAHMVGTGSADAAHARARGRATAAERPVGAATPRLAVRGITRRGFLADVAFDLHAGEILGVCGLVGSGRTELARAVCGVDAIDAGTRTLDGAPFAPRTIRQAVDAGVVYVPEDRKTQGLALRRSVADNARAAVLPRLARGPWLAPRAGLGVVAPLLAALGVAPPDPSLPAAALSGGNQQKVLLARALATRPRVLALDEPTRGVDVRAKAQIHAVIGSLAAEGTAVLLVSSDLPELLELSDRVLVLRRGRVVDLLPAAGLDEQALLLAASGAATMAEGVA